MTALEKLGGAGAGEFRNMDVSGARNHHTSGNCAFHKNLGRATLSYLKVNERCYLISTKLINNMGQELFNHVKN
jgi:hypothetical protein